MQRLLSLNQLGRPGDPATLLFKEDDVSQLTPSASPQEDASRPSLEYHDLRIPGARKEIGLLKLEIIQCFGLPKLDALGETDAYGLAVCGSYAFRTDVIPENANPKWSSSSRRACVFPVFQAYARLFVGIFDEDGESDRDDFAGRVVIDLARLRPNSEYDVVLPLRQSAHVYMKRPRGTIRLRLAIDWHSERQAILSYLPEKLCFKPEPLTVACRDRKAFQTIATTVHGTHLPGRFSLKMVKALIREIAFTRVHVLRYLRKNELRNLITWQYPLISCFVFVAWMHGVYWGTFKYLPGHVLTVLLLHLWKNYAQFVVGDSTGFVQPTWEELFGALVLGRNCIQPLRLSSSLSPTRSQSLGLGPTERLHTHSGLTTEASLHDVAVALRDNVPMKKRRSRLTFRGRDAVDFLIEASFAETREDAVQLGRELVTKLQLFEHIDQKYPFRDERTHYHFLNESPVVSTTPRPWGGFLLRALGFLRPKSSLDIAVDMPFAPGSEYPRLTVDGGMVHRHRRNSYRMNRSDSEDYDVANGLGLNFGDNPIQVQNDEDNRDNDIFASASTPFDESLDQPFERDDGAILVLKPPPDQNIDVIAKADKPVAIVLGEVRNEVHGYLLNAFNDQAFILKGTGETSRREQLPIVSEKETMIQKLMKRKSNKKRESQADSELSAFDGELGAFEKVGSIRTMTATLSDMAPPSPRKGKGFFRGRSNDGVTRSELEKLLKIGAASSSNPWLSKLGMVLQPMVEIAMAFLSIFRSAYNLFTWRDPILSFLVSFVGPIVVLLLHFFPWRLALGLFGLSALGPQHLLIRLWRERNGSSPSPDLDRLVANGSCGLSFPRKCEDYNEPTFSHKSGNKVNDTDSQELRHVMVPHSQLMYSHRFYDWPPEPQYSRVEKPASMTLTTTSAIPGFNRAAEQFELLEVVSESSEADDDITLTYVSNVTRTLDSKTGQRARALGGGKFHFKTQ